MSYDRMIWFKLTQMGLLQVW